MEARELRAWQLVAGNKVTRHPGGYWTVQGQTSKHQRLLAREKYKVVLKPNGSATCECEDHEIRGLDCKHILAVREAAKRESQMEWDWDAGNYVAPPLPEPPVKVARKTYTQDWPNYNRAQVTEKDHLQELLADLCRTIKEPELPEGRPGRKPVSLADAVFAAVFKVYVGFSGRRFSCDLEEARKRGHISRPLHFNTVLRGLDNPAVTPILCDLIHKSALPLRAVESKFAVDSSGFCTSRFDRWYDVKYGVKQKAVWVKAHALVGVQTNVVVTARILDQFAGDPTQFPPLVETAAELGFDLQEIMADKAYSTGDCFNAADKHGATLYAAFKSNATGAAGGLYGRAYHYFCLNREAFLKHYHQRSNIESSFSMMKRKHGDSVRSKTDVAMANEVLAKIVCHNLCCLISAWYELGIESVFTPSRTLMEEPALILKFPG